MTNRYQLTIGYLYGDLMNTYGDNGNIITLEKRASWRSIEVKIVNYSIGDKLKSGQCDLYFFGGGQDQAQTAISQDLIDLKSQTLIKDIAQGVPLLSICGGYQLLGAYYKPYNGSKTPGIGIFPVHTEGSPERMIGNIVIKSPVFGTLVGFENHSGKTFLQSDAQALGKVVSGFGNNGEDETEGCIYKNAIGCYMHGSLLPKNPVLADWLLQKALEFKYKKEVTLDPIDDTLEKVAHTSAVKKFGN